MNIKTKIIVFCGLLVSVSISSFASFKYGLVINNETVNADVIVKDGVTYVPLRVVSEKLNASISIEKGVISITNKNQAEPQTDLDYKKEVDSTNSTQTDYEISLIKDIKTLFDVSVEIDGDTVYTLNNENKRIEKNTISYWEEKIRSENESIRQQEADKKVVEDFYKNIDSYYN